MAFYVTTQPGHEFKIFGKYATYKEAALTFAFRTFTPRMIVNSNYFPEIETLGENANIDLELAYRLYISRYRKEWREELRKSTSLRRSLR